MRITGFRLTVGRAALGLVALGLIASLAIPVDAQKRGGTLTIVAQGCIATSGGPLADRLRIIHTKVAELIQLHSPQEIAVERVFLSKNADSALKLGQARGAALAAVPAALGVHEYAARAIKLAVVGVGGAEKAQVAHMVKQLLRVNLKLAADAADALAIAICHAHTRRLEPLLAGIGE